MGRPAAVVVTGEFVHEAQMQQRALGMTELQLVVIDHPLSTLSEAQIEERAAVAAPQCVAVWSGDAKR